MVDFRMVLSGTEEAIYVSMVNQFHIGPFIYNRNNQIPNSKNQCTGPGSDPPCLPRLRLQDAGVAP
jgi:hypothetical protein